MLQSFSETLRKNLLVFDGPMGTELYRHHVFTNRCFDELNLTDPGLIEQILTDYRDAGADVLTTNTFGANRPNLEKHGLAEKLADINKAGEQADALWEGKVDFIIFETQPSRTAMELCAKAMQQRPHIPYVLSCAVITASDGTHPTSTTGETIARLFAPFPDDWRQPVALGLNCGSGPEGLLVAAEEVVKIIHLPLIVKPNAGTPKEFEGRHLYFCSPEYAATYAMKFVSLGVMGVGGCCGMTPDHIREIAKMVKPLAKAHSAKVILKDAQPEVVEQPEVPLTERSRLGWKLAHRSWITTVELVPPRGYDLTDIIEKGRKLHRNGVDAINLPDGPRASSRISPMVVAQRILREAHIEPILHFCCRDRNLIGMQADLLGCAASDIHNLLFVTGDPPKLGMYPDATGVFDTDSIGMVSVQRRLNRGIDLGGQAVQPVTKAVIGVGLDPTALDRKRELDRFRMKVDAGAEFAITQPVFDADALMTFLDALLIVTGGELPIPIIAGIWPLASYRNAEFMHNEVPGVIVPEATMQRMAAVSKSSKEDQLAVGVEIAREMIEHVRHRVNGIQISAPFGRIDIVLAVLE